MIDFIKHISMKTQSIFLTAVCITFITFVFSYADFLEEASLPFTRVDVSPEEGKRPDAQTPKGGPLRILYIGQRDVVGRLSLELAELLDCRFETVLTENRTQIGLPVSRMENEAEVLSGEAIEKRAGRLFREKWDLIWLDFQFDALSEGFRLTLLDRVENGTGLVYVGNKRDINKVIQDGKVDDTQLEAATFGKIKPECAGKRKRGIVAVMPPLNVSSSIQEIGNYYFSAVNTILFTSQPDEKVAVTKIPEPGKVIEQESISIMNYRLFIINDGDTRPMNITARYRNEKGEFVEESSNSYSIETGKSFVTIEYPYLPLGTYSIEISITDQDGVIAFAGTSITVTSMNQITDIDMWEVLDQDGGYIMGNVDVAVPFTETVNIKVALLDCRGRLIAEKPLTPELSKKSVDFAFNIEDTIERVIIAQASLYSSNKLVQKLEKPVFIKRMFDKRRFSIVVADDRVTEPSSLERYEILREAGVNYLTVDMTQLSDPDEVFQTATYAASSGAGIIPRITRIVSTSQGDIMDPVITTVEYNEELEQRVSAFVDTLRYLALPAFSLGSDNMLTPYEEDVSFSETDIESFHLYLESKYETVDNLNTAWKTNFSSFDRILPIKFDEAKRKDTYEVWLDTRLHMEEVLTQVHYGAFDMFGETGSKTKVGIEGFENAWSPFRGYNLFELTGFLTMAVPGHDAGPGLPGDISVSAALSSFVSPGSFTGLSVGGETCFRSNELLLRAAPWQSLFLGMNSVWWRKAYGGVEAALTPQYRLSPAFSAVVEESREIMRGIDILLGGSIRLVDKIAILYSPVSKFAAYTSSSDHPSNIYSTSVRSFYQACQDGGYTPIFVAEDQLTGNWLSEKNFRVLILPYIQAVSGETAQCIMEFVKNGGTVLADIRPGVMDEHLFMRETGSLDTIFGVSQGTGRIASVVSGAFVPQEIEGGIPVELTFEDCLNDPAVEALEGVHVMAAAGNSPAVIVNRYGNGTGIYLNMGMRTYEKMRSEGRETIFREVISWCLYTGGMDMPYCTVRDSTGAMAQKVSITVFRDDTMEYVGLLIDPTVKSEYSSRKDFFLDLSRTGKTTYVYNIRTAEFLGANIHVPVDLTPGKAELFALIPYRVKGLDLKLKSPVIHTGGLLEYSVAVITQNKESKPGRHVFSIEVTGPDGKKRPYFSRSFDALKGELKSSLSISPDDSPGRWILTVQDVITGKKVERAFMIMATGSK